MTWDTVEQFRVWWQAHWRPLRHIVVLTGAGISAESGIPTFRGQEAFWNGMTPEELFTPRTLATDPARAWMVYDALRACAATAEPNAGHRALVTLADALTVTVITQNIDGLHQRAGSLGVLELHGTLWQVRCDACRRLEHDTRVPVPELPPRCPDCRGVLRPDIVLYTEPLPVETLIAAHTAARGCDLMLVVGTSGVVYPAASLPGVVAEHGGLTIEINPDTTPLSRTMDCVVRASAAMALPAVAAILAHVAPQRYTIYDCEG